MADRTFVNPFKKWYCFYCGKEIQLGQCAIYNWKLNQKLLDAPGGWWNRLRSRFFIETLDGPYFATNFASRQCPNCQKLLPPNIETAQNIVIAVLGDATVGKTHYIAACINHLNPGGPIHQLHEVEECLALNQEVEKKYRDTLYNTLFINRDRIPGDIPIRLARSEEEKLNDPLIYTLTVRRNPLPEKPVNLIIYDASGEDLANQEMLAKYKLYALDPDAIIYIADPLTIQSIEERTPYKKQSNLTPDYVLRWTIQLIKKYKRLRGEHLTIPIAITLSKSDLLTYIEPDDAPFKFLGQANYTGGLDLSEVNAIDQEVRSVLTKYGAFDLLYTNRLSENTCFFATSATGSAPDPDTGKFSNVEPRRCLDPLLWILYKLGVISAKGEKAIPVSVYDR